MHLTRTGHNSAKHWFPVAGMIGNLRREAGNRLFGERIRLGDGSDLGRISPEDLEDVRRRFPLPKFFILGHARSGTSYLARLIRLHRRVHCEWQTQFFSDRGPIPYFTASSFRHWLRHPSNKWVAGWDPTPVLLRVSLDTILEREARKIGKDIVGDKSPNENGHVAIRWLSAVYPDASLVYIVRDGRDTILSKRIQVFIDQPQTLGRRDRRVRRDFMENPAAFLHGARSIFTSNWLQDAARRWAEAVQASVRAGRELYGERFELVRYENLLQDPYPAMRRLWRFLGADADDADLESSVREQAQQNPEAEWHRVSGSALVRDLPRGVHGGWRTVFTTADQAAFERIAGAVLEAFDY
ncbi:MAG: sulfotransferase [candidate division NC10 bacterium]|nr:sulfotransferase [candidate division NC10 bacterium]MBM2842352.1 sulfotransferase [Anaerolineales bacterium]